MKFLAAIAAFFMSAVVQAEPTTFVADKGRTIYIRGEIADGAFDIASKVFELSKVKAPISLIINSPGGSIYAGLQIMSAIEIAQSRGVGVRCFVPVLAASMAFQILSICDERYVMQYTLLLFHPARAMLMGGFLADELEYQGAQLRRLDDKLKNELAARLGMDRKEYDYHYTHETLWLSTDLNAATDPDFVEVVNNFSGVEKPFDLQ